MRRLKEDLGNLFKPSMALIVYANDERRYYIESRRISKKGTLGAGAPLSHSTIKELLKYYNDIYIKKNKEESVSIGGIIPDNVLYFNSGSENKMIWFRPAETRRMYFVEDLNIPDGEANVPAMIYIQYGKNLKVFALDTDSKPALDTELFIPPYHNCSQDGSVCLGSAETRIPKNMTFDNLMEYWERLFWGSKFSHQNNDKSVLGNINLIWKDQIINPDKKFDANLLIKSGVKLKFFCK
jgi:PRTRC genetic system protein B